MEARARAITEQRELRQRDKSPGPANRHRRDKSTDGSIGMRFPVIASPRPDGSHGRNVSTVGLASTTKRASLEVPGSNDSSPVQPRNQSAVDRNAAARDANASASANVTTNGHHNQISSPESVSSPGVNLPGAFSGGGPGPHIPPPLDDDEHDQESDNSPSSAAASAASNPGSRPGSLKRTAVASERKPVGMSRASGVSGSLNRRLATAHADGSHPASGVSQGVQLSDRAMDDFS